MFGLTGIIAGIILVILGGALALIGPGPDRYQGGDFTIVFIFTGIIMVLVGIILMFW
jgi:hypothetical protein